MARLVLGTDKTATTPAISTAVQSEIAVRYNIDANNKIQKIPAFPNLSGATDVGPNAFNHAFYWTTFAPQTEISLTSLTTLTGSQAFYACFQVSRNIVSFGIPNVTEITGDRAFYYTFYGCYDFSSLDMSKVTTIGDKSLFGTSGAPGFVCYWMCNGADSLTTFDLSSLVGIYGAQNCCDMFRLTPITTANLPNLEEIWGYRAAYEMFASCSNLATVYLPKLKEIKGGSGGGETCYNMFYNCPNVTSIYLPSITAPGQASRQTVCTRMFAESGLQIIDMRNLTYAGDYCLFDNMLAHAGNLTTINLNALEHIGTGAMRAFLYIDTTNTTLQNIYFPMVTTFGADPFYTNAFGGRVINIHFRKDVQSTVEALPNYATMFGASSGSSILFDLAGTLTGADTNAYTRSESDSVYASETAGAAKTATAWTYNDTTYYTSGATEPQVGDAIYSDSACTTAVTTISSIA